MSVLTQPLPIDPRRWLLTGVLAIIALALIAGGVLLLLEGGSPYYLGAGLMVGGSAWLVSRGDRRGVWLYATMLAVTALWAVAECGLDPWGLQARLFAPAVLGIWVVWPWLQQIPPRWRLAIAVSLVAVLALALHLSNRLERAATARSAVPAGGATDWPHYGNTLGGTRFTQASQITPANVDRLERAWTFRTGANVASMGFEATPLMLGDLLYLCAPNNQVFAIDPDTGQKRWSYDPKSLLPPAGACRGVSYYKMPDATGPCAERIITATVDARLIALDSRTGIPCPGFGVNGEIDLKVGLGEVERAYYYVSSAPAIVRGTVILGGWVLDGQKVGEPSGVIRGFDAVTGAFKWAWDMGRPDQHGLPPAGESFTRGTPNSWGPISGDEALGLVYLPTGNSTPDYWGGHRSAASDKYSSSVVALDATTGQLRWSFQTVHHDLWDYDVAGQPTLIDIPVGGAMVPALVQATKQGQVYLLDRRTGTPLAEVVEKPVPQGAAPGDHLSPTQPFSIGMPAFDNTVLTERTMWGATPLDQLWCRIKFRQARYEGPMTPPGVKHSITYPSYLGGIDWGGVSVDPERKLLVVNWNRVANYTNLIPRAEVPDLKLDPFSGSHVGQAVPQMGTPFAVKTGAFLSPLGMPCTQPPFGKIAVVDLKTRRILWERPLGSARDSGPMGLRSHLPLQMGVPNTGGSLTTRAGLIFIGATQERSIRAFELTTGRRLWTAPLPAGGHASPMSYVSPRTGRQYVVIAAGGNGSLMSGLGDSVVAFALPMAN